MQGFISFGKLQYYIKQSLYLVDEREFPMKLIIPGKRNERYLFWFSSVISIMIETLIAIEIIPDILQVKMVQYVIILTPMFFCIRFFILNNGVCKKRNIYLYELRKGWILIFLLSVLSLFKSMLNGKFGFESVMEILQLFLPFVYTFFVMNFMTEKEIMSFMKIALLCTVTGYFVLVLKSDISIQDLSRISFIDSFSPFENHVFAEVASGLGAFFIYKRKEARGYCFIAIFLNFLIFKRVMMLMMLLLFLVALCRKENSTVHKKVITVSIVGWSALVFCVYNLYLPNNAKLLLEKTGIDLARFTMYRIYRLWYCIENQFTSYGLGSTTEFLRSLRQSWLGYEFEMDFIRIMFELGIIGIVLIVYTYMKMTRCNLYNYLLVSCCFLNLLMANGIVRYWGWTFRLITMAVVVYHGSNKYKLKDEQTWGTI